MFNIRALRASTASNAPVATVTTISANVAASLINQQIAPIQDSQLAALLNSQLPADIEPEFTLLPGFNLIDKQIAIFKLKIGSIGLSKATALDIFFIAYLRVKLTLNSQVDIFPSLKVEVLDGATLYMDLSDTGSSITGFDQTKVSPNFDINAPNVSFCLTNGFTTAFQAETRSSSFPDIGGNITAALGLPMLNTTVTEIHQVNSICQPASGPGTYDNAVHVQYADYAALNFNGSINTGPVHIKVPTNVPKIEISKPLGNQCYNWDLSSNSVKQVSAASISGPSLSKLGLVSLLAFLMAAGTF